MVFSEPVLGFTASDNLVADPGEKNDLTEKEPDRVRELRELMAKRHRDVNGR